MAEKKKGKKDGWAGWSKPVIKGPKKKPQSASTRSTVARKAEEQRRGMAATRKKAQAARPTLSQKRAIQQRDKERAQDAKLNSAAARRSRERMRAEGR